MMLLAKVLARILGEGRLTIIDAAGRSHCLAGARPGPPSPCAFTPGGQASAWSSARGSRSAKSYMDGKLTVEDGDIYDLLDLLGRNIAAVEATPARALVATRCRSSLRFARSSTIRSAGRSATSPITTISTTSSTISSSTATGSIPAPTSRRPATSLEQAQIDKKRHIAAKLLLKPGQRVLDIGSGWGGMGLFLGRAVRRRRDRRHPVEGAAQPSPAGARSRAASPTACASSCSTIARSPAATTASSRSACSSMSAPPTMSSIFTKVKDAAGRRRRHAAALDRPHGAAGRHQHLAAQVHLPGGYSPALSEVLAAIEKVELVGHRHRDPAPALCRNAPPLARSASRPTARRSSRPPATTSASAGCGNSTSPAARCPFAT